MAIQPPRLLQGGCDDGAAMTATLKVRKRGDILYESVLAAVTKQIGHGDQHAGRDDPPLRLRHEDVKTLSRDSLMPNLFCFRFRFDVAADACVPKQLKHLSQVVLIRNPRFRH